ncbi:uncharacterized protein LOC107852967 [Capsicum annuum]|uniref:uncharacterized protein LOC107852967 n=1 Tax=Capsicum annuum TaxID=4072 RepID=UPI001FB18A3C|nr:uncharacterized protein LOC107852967 [Capsicum annuum]
MGVNLWPSLSLGPDITPDPRSNSPPPNTFNPSINLHSFSSNICSEINKKRSLSRAHSSHIMIEPLQLRIYPHTPAKMLSTSQGVLVDNSSNAHKAFNATALSKVESIHISPQLTVINSQLHTMQENSSHQNKLFSLSKHDHYDHNPSLSNLHSNFMVGGLSLHPICLSTPLMGRETDENSHPRSELLSSISNGMPQLGPTTVWSKCLDRNTNAYFQFGVPGGTKSYDYNKNDEPNHLKYPFFSTPQPTSPNNGTSFCKTQGGKPLPSKPNPLSLTLSYTPQNIKVLKREKTLEALRVRNREMESLLL